MSSTSSAYAAFPLINVAPHRMSAMLKPTRVPSRQFDGGPHFYARPSVHAARDFHLKHCHLFLRCISSMRRFDACTKSSMASTEAPAWSALFASASIAASTSPAVLCLFASAAIVLAR